MTASLLYVYYTFRYVYVTRTALYVCVIRTRTRIMYTCNQGCIYVDSHRNLRINMGQLRIKRQIDSQRCDSSVADVMQSEINKQLKKQGF